MSNTPAAIDNGTQIASIFVYKRRKLTDVMDVKRERGFPKALLEFII